MFVETDLLKKTKSFAEELLVERTPERFFYHNLDHTREVVAAAEEIGLQSNLSNQDLETVLIAAWLHDTGYCSFGVNGHEEASAKLAESFLQEHQVPSGQIDSIVRCIRATKMPQQPDSFLAQVLCDADLYHLSTDDFKKKSELLRQEVSYLKGRPITEPEWIQSNFAFLSGHRFFTQYGQTNLQPRQEKNLHKLEKKMKHIIAEAPLVASGTPDIPEEEHKEGHKEKLKKLEKQLDKLKAKIEEDKSGKPGRGVETMFRTTSTNHYHLSEMADNKANIMITINSLIVSIIVSVLIRKFEEFPNLVIPTAILTLVCLTTIVFAVLATRPRFTRGTFNKEDVHSKQTNLLFFGNFHQMELKDYEWGMKETLKDSDLLYTSMIRDIYYLGKVLGQKYKLLRISYTIFMFGFVIAVLSYGIALVFFPVY